MTERKKDVWDYTFERFCDNYPHYAKDIVDWYPSGCREITFKMKDDSRRTYNWLTDKVSVTYEPDIDGEFKKFTDDELYRKFQIVFNAKLRDMMMTQERLSEETGISRITISKYSNGKALPNYINLRKICHALKCSPTELYIYK